MKKIILIHKNVIRLYVFFLNPVVFPRGPSGTLLKEQGSYSLAQNIGYRGPVIKA